MGTKWPRGLGTSADTADIYLKVERSGQVSRRHMSGICLLNDVFPS